MTSMAFYQFLIQDFLGKIISGIFIVIGSLMVLFGLLSTSKPKVKK